MDNNSIIPNDIAKRMYLDHFAIILSKLAIFSSFSFLLVSILPIAISISYGIFIIFYTLVILAIIFLTVGLILVSKNVRHSISKVYASDDIISRVQGFYDRNIFWINSIGILSLILLLSSIVIIILNKGYEHHKRIVFQILLSILVLLVLVIRMVN